MARLDSMATIDAALQQTQEPDTVSTTVQQPDLLMPPTIAKKQEVKADENTGFQPDQASLEDDSSVLNRTTRIFKRTGVNIERMPTPGSLVFPLVILLVFFFLLLPVNGHTRFVWIWLTLTGNADISSVGSAGSGLASSPPSPATNSSPAPNGFITVPIQNTPIPMMTGVEDL